MLLESSSSWLGREQKQFGRKAGRAERTAVGLNAKAKMWPLSGPVWRSNRHEVVGSRRKPHFGRTEPANADCWVGKKERDVTG